MDKLRIRIILCCLCCYYFVLSLNWKLYAVDQQLFKTANKKQQNTENVLLLVENCEIKHEILHKHNPFERIRDPDNCDVRVIVFVKVFHVSM